VRHPASDALEPVASLEPLLQPSGRMEKLLEGR